MAADRRQAELEEIYRRLFNAWGPQHWWPAKTPFEVIVGAILTQSAAWGNVEKGIANLKKGGFLSPKALRGLPQAELAQLVHPCGYYNVKARKLKAFAEWLGANYGDSLEKLFSNDINELRQQLLGVYGVGDETADSIILYAGNKPVFVIDAYTRRITGRLGIAKGKKTYADYQALFMDNLPPDVKLFNEYHALLVNLAKTHCRVSPDCKACPLNTGEAGKNAPKDRGCPCAALLRR
jgi:endonuclease III related protein